MAKEYHIVSGDSARGTLLQSNVIDFSNPNVELIRMLDNLNQGKLFDLKTLEGIDERVKWFEDFYQETDSYYHRESHSKKLLTKLNEISSDDSVYLWLGNDGNEYICKAAILEFLEKVDPVIYVLDWMNVKCHNSDGRELVLWSLYVCDFDNIELVKEYFRVIPDQEKLFFVSLWNKLLMNNTDLRVLNRANQIEESDIHYYDDILISNCQLEFQFSFKVVGMVIGSLYNGFNSCGIGDMFLIERLKQLCYEGKLQMRNQEHGQRNGNIFEVALIQ